MNALFSAAAAADEGLLGVHGGGDWAAGDVMLNLQARHVVTSSQSLTAPQSDGGPGASTIFWLCVVMYGCILVAWLVYSAAHPNRREDSIMHTGMLCLSWASCSIGMIVLNKELAVELQAPALIAMAQMALCFGTMVAVCGGKLLEADRRQLGYWMAIPCFFAGMLCSSIYTVQYISISLFTVIRNLMPLVTLPMETVLMPPDKQPRVSKEIVASLLVTLAGAVMYAQGIKGVSVLGILFAVMNMCITVCDRILQRRLLTQECKDLHVVVCTMVTNLCGIFPCLALAFMTPQFSELPKHKASWTDPKVLTMLALSGFVSIGIGALGFEVQRRLSATSFLIMQNISKIAVIVIGVVVFGDTVKSWMACLGLLVSLIGGFMYSRLQMLLNAEEKPLVDKSRTEATKASKV